MKKLLFKVDYEGDLVPATFRNGKKAVAYQSYNDYKEILQNLYKLQWTSGATKQRLFKVRCTLRMHVAGLKKPFYRADIDNLIKPILDAGTKIIWYDDQQVTELHVKLDNTADKPGFTAWFYDIGKWHRYRLNLHCLNCGKAYETNMARGFYTDGHRSHFCSLSCRTQYRKTPHVCTECGVTYHRKTSAQRGLKFCSHACYWEHLRKHPEMYKNLAENLAKASAIPHYRNNKGQFTMLIGDANVRE